jgi:hypothetical protein
VTVTVAANIAMLIIFVGGAYQESFERAQAEKEG